MVYALTPEGAMILVRDVFQLKFGKARDAVALWKEGAEIARRTGYSTQPMRLLTDLVGPYYTFVMEGTFPSLGDWERAGRETMAADEWRSWYQRFLPLAEGGYREVFTIVE
jgi:hypothetical protein